MELELEEGTSHIIKCHEMHDQKFRTNTLQVSLVTDKTSSKMQACAASPVKVTFT